MHGEIPATSPTTGNMHDLRRSARNRSPSAALPSPSIQARRVAPASQTAGRAPSRGPRPVARMAVLSTPDRPFVASPFRAPTGERWPPASRSRWRGGRPPERCPPASPRARCLSFASRGASCSLLFDSSVLPPLAVPDPPSLAVPDPLVDNLVGNSVVEGSGSGFAKVRRKPESLVRHIRAD